MALHDLNVLGPSQDAPRYSGFVEVYPFDIFEYRTKDNYNSPMASVDFLQISLMYVTTKWQIIIHNNT